VLSRVADSLYWMSRYLERAEHTARLLDVHHTLTLELHPEQEQKRYRAVLATLQVSEAFWEGTEMPTPESMTFGTRPDSIASCIASARENARQIREQISSEMFEEINRLYLHSRTEETHRVYHVEPHLFYRQVKEGAQLFQGLTDSTMTHGQGWQFIQVGRYLERSGALANLLQSQLVQLLDQNPHETYLELLGTLKSCTAWEAYCKVYSAELCPTEILNFLLLNRNFPHSVHFSVKKLVTSFQKLAESTGMTHRSNLEPVLGKLQAELQFTTPEELVITKDGVSDCPLLGRVQQALNLAHSLLYRCYLSEHWERSSLSW
jgi:uncharacterized alpha-E superfamily protein